MSEQLPVGPPRSRATIRDVATLAGVGIKTVSRVINDEANVAPQTRDRVHRAVSALNFKPNLGAGALRRGDRKTRTLGLLLDAVDNPFSAALNRGVEVVAAERGTAVFAAGSADDPERERALVEAFTRRRVDALILTTATSDHGYLQAEREQGMVVVFVDRPPVGLLADAVLTDNQHAAEVATQHLLDHGHQRIAYLGDDLAIATAQQRRAGYTVAMQRAGLGGLTRYRDDLRSERDAHAAIEALLATDEAPTALFAAQNLVTLGALRALHDLGLQRRVALVGFDDLALADLVEPGLTVMAQDPIRIGTLAATRVFQRLDGDTSQEDTQVVPATLVVRGSGEITPDESFAAAGPRSPGPVPVASWSSG